MSEAGVLANEPPFGSGCPAVATPDGAARLRRLVDTYFDFIWRTLRRLGVPEADADDAAQQVFLVAARKISLIDPNNERSFLFGTALRVASDARRARRRRREEPAEPGGADPCDGGPGPEDLVAQRRARALLDEVLEAMPLDLQTVFVLFELEELPTPEIASLLGIPTGTVASRLRRAREEFQDRAKRLQARYAPRGGLP